MIEGKVTARRDAVVPIVNVGQDRETTCEAVVDTGFTEFLALPPNLVAQLGLSFVDVSRAMLADGSIVGFDLYRAVVVWNEIRRDILIHASDGGPLLGMSMLYGSRLLIDVVDGGAVQIESTTP